MEIDIRNCLQLFLHLDPIVKEVSHSRLRIGKMISIRLILLLWIRMRYRIPFRKKIFFFPLEIFSSSVLLNEIFRICLHISVTKKATEKNTKKNKRQNKLFWTDKNTKSKEKDLELLRLNQQTKIFAESSNLKIKKKSQKSIFLFALRGILCFLFYSLNLLYEKEKKIQQFYPV